MTNFTFRNGALIQHDDEAVTIYGSWDEHFGCWHAESDQHAFRPVVPTACLFGCYELELAFQRYADTIPARCAVLAGHFERHQWLALDAIRHVPGFADFLEQEVRTGGVGFVVACWELAHALDRPAYDRHQLAEDMMNWKRADLLARLTDTKFAPAVARLLQRANSNFICPAFVEELRQAILVGGKAGVLGQVRPIDENAVVFARLLPDWLCVPWVIDRLARSVEDWDEFNDRFPSELLDPPDRWRPGILRAIKAIPSHDCVGVWRALERCASRLAARLSFPLPPIPGDTRLRPICKPADLIREGKEMRHCAADFMRYVTKGIFYCYQWHGEERATVSLSKDEVDGRWYIFKHLGCGNEPLSAQTVMAIREVVDVQLTEIQPGLTVHVVGAQDCPPDVTAGLESGDEVTLRREPHNGFNPSAIAVYAKDVRLGYVAWDRAESLAAKIDTGAMFAARVAEPAARTPRTIFIDVGEVPARPGSAGELPLEVSKGSA